jgi:hypothetical protein
MRKFVCAAIFTLVAVTFVAAEEISVRIYKCDADKGCFEYKKYVGKGKDKKVEDTVLKGELAKGAKIVFGKKDPDDKKKTIDGDAIEKGLKNDIFADDKGVAATIFTADDGGDKGKVMKVRVNKGKKAAN